MHVALGARSNVELLTSSSDHGSEIRGNTPESFLFTIDPKPSPRSHCTALVWRNFNQPGQEDVNNTLLQTLLSPSHIQGDSKLLLQIKIFDSIHRDNYIGRVAFHFYSSSTSWFINTNHLLSYKWYFGDSSNALIATKPIIDKLWR